MTGGYHEQDPSTFELDHRVTELLHTGLTELSDDRIAKIYTQLVNGVNIKIVYDDESCFKFYCPFNRQMECTT
jgi:hypothetical protein